MAPRLNTNKFQVVFPMMPDLATIQDDLLMDSHDLLFHLMLVHEPISRSPFIQETNEFGGELEWRGSQICGSNLKFGTHLLQPVG